MKKYIVFHDYGTEGWKIHAECDTLLEAARARESDLQNTAGGTSEIFEHLSVFAAYRRADDELGESLTGRPPG